MNADAILARTVREGDCQDWASDPTGRTAIRNILLGADDLIVSDISGRHLFHIRTSVMMKLIPFIRFTLTRRGGGVRAHWAKNDAIDDRLEIRPESVIRGGDSTGLRAGSLETRNPSIIDELAQVQGGLPGMGKNS